MWKLIKFEDKRKRTIEKSKEQFNYNLGPGIPKLPTKTQELKEGESGKKKPY